MIGKYRLNAFVTSSLSIQLGNTGIRVSHLPESQEFLNQERKKPSILFTSFFPLAALSHCEINLFVTAPGQRWARLHRFAGTGKTCLPRLLADLCGIYTAHATRCGKAGHRQAAPHPNAVRAHSLGGAPWSPLVPTQRPVRAAGEAIPHQVTASPPHPVRLGTATSTCAGSARVFGTVRGGATFPGNQL